MIETKLDESMKSNLADPFFEYLFLSLKCDIPEIKTSNEEDLFIVYFYEKKDVGRI